MKELFSITDSDRQEILTKTKILKPALTAAAAESHQEESAPQIQIMTEKSCFSRVKAHSSRKVGTSAAPLQVGWKVLQVQGSLKTLVGQSGATVPLGTADGGTRQQQAKLWLPLT